MTRAERQRFLLTFLAEVPRYAPLFFTLAGTGMRLGEALALQWGDVDVFAREIRVVRALSAGQLDTPKSGHGRTVDMSQSLSTMLAGLQKAWRAV